ncbi:putative ribonuclease H protein At1g65750 family [Senna tora]|uniref:Putative ribonuclease H protein At1g65750 family n=1 Tax=Senna tora TaxID=362788 RepID=A0A834SZG8_9FABA|nr:putative ribonuclease H protein At1g65750 family [Senna tora]
MATWEDNKPTDSRLWREILKVWPDFYKHIVWNVGNGNTIKLWDDSWIQGVPNLRSQAVNNNIQGLDETTLSDHVDANGQWKLHELNETLPPAIIDRIRKVRALDCLLVAISNVFINPRDRASFYLLPLDEWIGWNLERKVCFASVPWSVAFSVACHNIWAWRNLTNKSSENTCPKEPHRIILHQAKQMQLGWSMLEERRGITELYMEPMWRKPNLP